MKALAAAALGLHWSDIMVTLHQVMLQQPYGYIMVMPVVLLIPLFAAPRVGKAQAKRLEEDSRNHGNCRHGYSFLAGAAATTQSPSWLTWQLKLQP